MLLIDGKKGYTYTVRSVTTADTRLERRLRMLGMTDGSSVSILGKKHGGNMIIKIRGTRFAVGNEITKSVILGGETTCRKL